MIKEITCLSKCLDYLLETCETRFQYIYAREQSSDPHIPKPEKIKKFWSFVKSLKKDTFGITSLRENGILKTDSKEKANICNGRFQ